MFVQLGSTYHPHRAHVVRGVLEAHGIPVEVLHEESAHLYAPGWQPCFVMIPEDDAEAALEVMNACPESPLPEDASGEVMAPFRKHPTFLDWLITGAGLLLLFGMSEGVATVLEQMESTSTGVYFDSSQLNPIDIIVYVVGVVPAGGVLFAVMITVFMAPLMIWDGDRWMGMIAYLFVRWLLFFALPVLVAVACGALRSR